MYLKSTKKYKYKLIFSIRKAKTLKTIFIKLCFSAAIKLLLNSCDGARGLRGRLVMDPIHRYRRREPIDNNK